MTTSDGKLPALPKDPSREDYTFQGWFTEKDGGTQVTTNTVFDQDATIYAHWKGGSSSGDDDPKGFSITLSPNGGALGSGSSTLTTSGGKLTALPKEPQREGYTFLGWFTEKDGGEKVTTDTVFKEGTTIYAHWKDDSSSGDDKPVGPGDPKEYTVTLFPSGGTLNSDSLTLITSGGKLTALPDDLSLEGHTFLGWFTAQTGGEQVTTDTVFKEDTTIYAHWKDDSSSGDDKPDVPGDSKEYTVTFDSRGGSKVAAQTVAGGGRASRPAAPIRSDYDFLGWYKEADCTTAWKFSSDAVTRDVTLYAKWRAKTTSTPTTNTSYTVTFDPNGGSGGATLTTDANGRLSSLPANPTYTDQTFDGWYTAASGGTRVTTSTVFRANATVYAHWKQNSTTTSPSTTGDYQIYTPNSVSGGSFVVSHSSAPEGTLITVQISPWNNYELSRLSALRADTGAALRLTGLYNNQYTFSMPASDVRLTIAYTQKYSSSTANSSNIYNQAPASARPVNWYYRNGSIYHVTDGLVPYTNPITRDMLVSVLYNMDASSFGTPTVWAANNGIIPDIYANWLWGPDKSISREQTAAILFCYAKHMGYNTFQRASLSGYTDSSLIRSDAWSAMSWSQAVGLITGTSNSTLSPQDIVTCGQANTILARFLSNVVGTR